MIAHKKDWLAQTDNNTRGEKHSFAFSHSEERVNEGSICRWVGRRNSSGGSRSDSESKACKSGDNQDVQQETWTGFDALWQHQEPYRYKLDPELQLRGGFFVLM